VNHLFCFLIGSMLLNLMSGAAFASGEVITITVDADEKLGNLYSFWNVFPETVQAPFKDETRYEELRKRYPYAKYINCVRYLGGINMEKDDYFRGIDAEGGAICDFTEAIALLAGIRKCGYTPWIVLDNVPAAMSDDPVKNKYGNTLPPVDFKVWSSYVRQLVQTLVEEFGRAEVRQWRFRVGTEPDLKPGHWNGTKEEYFEHYDHTVKAVLDVLPDAEIAPGNIIDPIKKRKWKSWGLDIIDHCATGTNYATGGIGTPMKFFASSYYTAVGNPDERFAQVIAAMRARLAKYPQFADIPVEIQEFGVLTENGKLLAGDGTEFGGSWTAHMARKIYTLGVPRAYQWHWNTTKGGLPIPVTHVLGMLEEMVGSERLSARASRESEEDDIGCIASRKGGAIHLLVYRHLAVRDNGDAIKIRVVLEGESLGKSNWKLAGGSITDGEHSGFMHEQKADMEKERAVMGEDANPYAVAFKVISENRPKYERMSRLSTMKALPRLTADGAGGFYIDLELDGHSVVHLRLR
jgi:xylan 1,4-beta-xylosidase